MDNESVGAQSAWGLGLKRAVRQIVLLGNRAFRRVINDIERQTPWWELRGESGPQGRVEIPSHEFQRRESVRCPVTND